MDIDAYLLLPRQVRALARRAVAGKVMVSADDRVIDSAFHVALMLLPPLDVAARELVGALIGDMREVVAGRSVNGWPVFTSVGFLHVSNLATFHEEVAALRAQQARALERAAGL